MDIKQVAKLAKLDLTESEENKFSKQLTHVLKYFEKISEVETKGVVSRGQVTVEGNRFREDVVEPERVLRQKEALGQAKRTYKGFFIVDAVIDKS